MTYVPTAIEPQLSIEGVYDAGSPNFERILFWASGALNLAGFGITLAFKTQAGAHPVFDSCYWFPAISIEGPSWVVVYSRPGTPEWTEEGGTPVLHLFWQRGKTIFNAEMPTFIPVLFRTDGVALGDLK